ncbi:unnamed protein product [Rotaria socialis]
MTDFIHLPVDKLVKKLFDDERPIDFGFLEYRDETTNEKRFHYPVHHRTGCNTTLQSSNDFENLIIIFSHIYKFHAVDTDLIKRDYDKWYQEQKNLASISHFTTDTLTSSDVEELFDTSSTITKTIAPLKDQRETKGNQYFILSNELSSKTNSAIADFIAEKINNNELKAKINSLDVGYLEKVSKM